MKQNFTSLPLIGFILTVLIMIFSCEKDSDNRPIDGTWEFYMNCNKIYYRGCIFNTNREFTEILRIDGNSISKFYDDSLVHTSGVDITDSLIIYGKNVFAQKYILRNDTLTLIDTCFACDYNVYFKIK